MRQIVVSPLPVPPQVGDAAITVGAMRLLREGFPGARIVGVARASVLTDAQAERGLIEAYGVDEVIPHPETREWNPAGLARHPLPARALGRVGQVRSLTSRCASITTSHLLRRRAWRLFGHEISRLIRTLSESDLVVLRGGGYLTSPHWRCDLAGLKLDSLYVVSLARALGVPYAIWGHSFFDLKGPLAKRFLLPIIRDSAVTVCREQLSKEFLLGLGAEPKKVAVLPDTAFAVAPASPGRVREILAQKGLDEGGVPVLGLNVGHGVALEGVGETRREQHLRAFAELVDHMQDAHGVPVVLISHGRSTRGFRVARGQDGHLLQGEVLRRVAQPSGVRVLRGEEFTPAELVGIYSTFRAVVTTRQHVGILSASGGTPGLFIAYEKTKTHGIAQMLGMDDFVLDIEDITAAALVERAEALWDRSAALRGRLASTLSGLKRQLPQYVTRTREGISGRLPKAS